MRTRGSQEKGATDDGFGGERPTSKRRGRCVAHVDADAFFAAVEKQRNPRLRDVPVAVRQHGDIICVDHRARELGATKHMNPDKCRALLTPHGGEVVHVHSTDDHMLSYEPYTRASYELHAKLYAACERLRVDGGTLIYQRASVDEAYVQLENGAKPSQRGKAFAESIRRAIAEECGYSVSVGVARNKMLAKIASKLAKPNGVVVIEDEADLERCFRQLPSSHLPKCNEPLIRRNLALHNLRTAWDVRELNAKRLEALVGLTRERALALCKAAHGVDDSEVVHKVHEKNTLSSSMTLTMVPKPLPKNVGSDVGVTGGPAGWYNPLTCGERERIELTLGARARDLYSTIKVHQAYTERWPSTLTVKMAIEGTSVQYSKSAAFPVKFEDATSETAEDVLTKKATELALLTVGKRTTDKIREVAVVVSNFKSSTGARERTREEIMTAEADRLPKLFLRSREQQLERDVKENAQRRVRAKRARNERWIEALQPLPPVDMLIALIGGWDGEDECPLEVEQCRLAIRNRQAKCVGDE